MADHPTVQAGETTAERKVRYELHHDQLEDKFEIKRVETLGTFESRGAAVQWMRDTADERRARDE